MLSDNVYSYVWMDVECGFIISMACQCVDHCVRMVVKAIQESRLVTRLAAADPHFRGHSFQRLNAALHLCLRVVLVGWRHNYV